MFVPDWMEACNMRIFPHPFMLSIFQWGMDVSYWNSVFPPQVVKAWERAWLILSSHYELRRLHPDWLRTLTISLTHSWVSKLAHISHEWREIDTEFENIYCKTNNKHRIGPGSRLKSQCSGGVYHIRNQTDTIPSVFMCLKHDSLFWKCSKNYVVGNDLLPTDFQHSDGFALLAAHLLLDCCDRSGM